MYKVISSLSTETEREREREREKSLGVGVDIFEVGPQSFDVVRWLRDVRIVAFGCGMLDFFAIALAACSVMLADATLSFITMSWFSASYELL